MERNAGTPTDKPNYGLYHATVDTRPRSARRIMSMERVRMAFDALLYTIFLPPTHSLVTGQRCPSLLPEPSLDSLAKTRAWRVLDDTALAAIQAATVTVPFRLLTTPSTHWQQPQNLSFHNLPTSGPTCKVYPNNNPPVSYSSINQSTNQSLFSLVWLIIVHLALFSFLLLLMF